MRAKPLLVLSAGLLLAAACLLWWRATNSRRQSERALANELDHRSELVARLHAAETRLHAAEKQREVWAREVEQRASSKAPVGNAAKKAGPPAAAPRTMTEIISNDPDAEVRLLRWQRAVVTLEYGPFFRARGISPEQIQRFQENWVKREEQGIDLRAAARKQDPAGREMVAALQRQAGADYEAAQADVLGAENYRLMQDYQRTLVVRNVVVLGLAGVAAIEGVPLSAAQGDQLWQAALAATGGANSGGEDLVRAIDWDVLDSEAQRILTPAQFTLFKNTASPSGFRSRWHYELEAAVRRAHAAEATAKALKPGGS